MMQKNQISTLPNQWNNLLSSTFSQLAAQAPSCDSLAKLILMLNAIVKTFAANPEQNQALLDISRDNIATLIASTRRIDYLIKATRAIARIAKGIDASWVSLLDICCSRLNELIVSTENIRHLVNTINLIARIAPLLSAGEQECLPEKATPSDAAEESPQPVDDEYGNPDTEPLTPQNPVYAREVAETMRDLRYDIEQNVNRLRTARAQLKTAQTNAERRILNAEINTARNILVSMNRQYRKFKEQGFSCNLPVAG